MSSKLSILNFHYGSSRKSMPKPAQFTNPKERQRSSTNTTRAFQPSVEEMKRVFDKFDTNKDGKISKEEYTLLLKSLGAKNSNTTRELVARAFEASDTDGDGFIDFQEFMKVQQGEGGVKTADIETAFRVFDLDGNRKISAEELSEVMRRLGERCSLEACRKMVRSVDADGDGLIDIDEFMGMMTRNMKLA